MPRSRLPLKVALALLASALALAAHPAAAQSRARVFALAGLDAGNALVLFRSDTPQATRVVRITGTRGRVIGIDVRPIDGKLYGIDDGDVLYTIDPRSGAATRISRLGSPFDRAPGAGFDFNPQSDRLRLVSGTGQNLRVNAKVGAVGIDGTLRYASDDEHAGQRPKVSATAYTRSVARTPVTETFDIDYALDILVQQDPPNDGVLETIGPLGIDCDEAAGFDIATDAGGGEHPFLVCGATLHRVDLKSGAARRIGAIGHPGGRFIGLAVLSVADAAVAR